MLVTLVPALVLVLLAPHVLARGRWQVRRPRLALTAWFGAFLAGCLALLGGIFWVVVAALQVETGEGVPGLGLSVLAWLVLSAAGGVLALVGGMSEPLTRSYHRALREAVPIATSREERDDFTLVRFDSAVPVALAHAGGEREVLVSNALERELSVPQLEAVLAHELAHLRYRHGALLRIAEINAACLPRWLPAGENLRRATTLLIELVADDAAARAVGPAHLANALVRLGSLSGDPSFELRAHRLAMRPWRRQRPIGLAPCMDPQLG